MKIYHYTKGLKLKSIFADGFIATEQKRNTNYQAPFFTDLVWLTEKTTVPVTALPFIPMIPSTNLTLRKQMRGIPTDYASISKFIGGFWRFGFDSNFHKCEKWFYSEARKNAHKIPGASNLDKLANKVGDDIRSFWISENDIPLENFTLEFLDTNKNEWIEYDPEALVFDDIPNTNSYAIHGSPLLKAA